MEPTSLFLYPWATFAANVTIIPAHNRNQASQGALIPTRAEWRITIDAAYTKPSIVKGIMIAVMPLSPYSVTTA